MSAETCSDPASAAGQVLANYFRAKDGNRPHLLERVFCADAELEIKNATAAIEFPAVTRGREAIADVLVRNFGRDNENVYSFYLSPPPGDAVDQFSCRWLVGMTEKSGKSVRVGCGTYHWKLNYRPLACATALAISIEVMQLLPAKDADSIMLWLARLPYPWCSAACAADSAPSIEQLKPVIEHLNERAA